MPFRESVRKYWLRVSGGGDEDRASCEARIYSEEGGFQKCGSRVNLEVHHIPPASVLIAEGIDPDSAVGLVVCRYHHRTAKGDVPYEQDTSFHPEMAQALDDYRRGNKNAFAEAAHEYRRRAECGERVSTGDWGTDEAYTDYMRRKESAYIRRTGDKPPSTESGRRRHWYDNLFTNSDKDEKES